MPTKRNPQPLYSSSIRIPVPLAERVAQFADSEDRSMNSAMERLITRGLDALAAGNATEQGEH